MNGLRRSEPHPWSRLRIMYAMRFSTSKASTMTDLNGRPASAFSSSTLMATCSTQSNPTSRNSATATYSTPHFGRSPNSEGRIRSIALSQERMQRFCHQCPYFGNCPGTFVANATSVERKILEESGCPVRAVLEHIVDVFRRTDLHDYIVQSCKTADGASASSSLALSVA